MPLSPSFPGFILELLAGFGPVQVKRMFGGAGLYRDDVGFAILDDDVCYLKADVSLGTELKVQGSQPWSYSIAKDGSVRDIAYWSLPDTAADDPDEATELARRSFAIASTVAAAKAAKPKPKPRKTAAKAVTQPAPKPRPKAHK